MLKKIGGVAVVALVAAEPATAASALDTGLQTAVTGGLNTVVDTLKDLLTLALGIVVSGAVLRAVPGMVTKLVKKAAG